MDFPVFWGITRRTYSACFASIADSLVAGVMAVSSDAVDVACEQNHIITHAVNINLLLLLLLLLLFYYQRRIKNSVSLGLRIEVCVRIWEKVSIPEFPSPFRKGLEREQCPILSNVFRVLKCVSWCILRPFWWTYNRRKNVKLKKLAQSYFLLFLVGLSELWVCGFSSVRPVLRRSKY